MDINKSFNSLISLHSFFSSSHMQSQTAYFLALWPVNTVILFSFLLLFFFSRGKILEKRINVRIEHVNHSKCRDDFLRY